MNTRAMLLPLLAASVLCGCRQAPSGPAPPVAATNSLLECAVRDLLGESAPVLRLAEPGMCPGHFDIRPSQVKEVRRCRILLRLDFQASLDAKIAGSGGGPRIVEVGIPGGLCEPASYLAACRETADALVEANLLERTAADERLKAVAARLDGLEAECLRKTARLRDLPVVASTHQEAFCRRLGLRVVATFSGADTALPSHVDRAVKSGEEGGARLVIANLPEGRRVADSLAERLRAKVVVFGNFPALGAGHSRFDDLVTANVRALVEAASP